MDEWVNNKAEIFRKSFTGKKTNKQTTKQQQRKKLSEKQLKA